MFDIIVIGKGLFGASATRYLSQSSVKVAVIGPDEPADPTTHPGIFGAHYDQARIIHQLNENLTWATLTRRSLSQFQQLEVESGLHFYHPAGTLYMVSPVLDKGYVAALEKVAAHFGVEYARPDHPSQQATFPFLRFPVENWMVWEKPPSGHFNPRHFLQAQLILAERQGATLIREIATSVRDKGEYVEVVTETGQPYRTRKVLIATGAFSNGFNLFSRALALHLKIEFVLMAQISPTEAKRLREMPAVIYLLDSPSLAEAYLLPPVRYPDGKIYLKLGANTMADRYVETLAEICGWYRAGDSEVMLPHLQTALLEMMPGVQVISWHTHRCVITRTAHGYPYLDTIVPGKIYVAVGGNGRAAQTADAIGQLAADLVIHEAWRDALDPALFRVRFADERLDWTSRPLFSIP